MKRVLSIISGLLFFVNAFAQVNAPDVRCISVNATGDVTLNWIIPPDPNGDFFRYDIYKSNTAGGTYTLVGNVSTYFTTSFTEIIAGGNTASRYYYVRTVWGAGGTNTSTPSDTVNSIFLSITGSVGRPQLNYNNIHSPKLVTSSSGFDLYREFPTAVWSNFISTPNYSYIDTVTRCSIFYNYQIQLKDNSGCTSSSNISGGNYKDDTYPVTPLLDSISVDCSGQSHLGWESSSSPDCAGYIIYLKNASGIWVAVDTVYGITNAAYTYTNIAAGNKSLDFRVAAIDSCGNTSPMGLQHSTLFLKARFDTCAHNTVLSWNSYQNMPLGTIKYEVFCSENNGPYNYIGVASGNSFLHDNVSPGKTYCYVVRAFNSPLLISAKSNCACFFAGSPNASSFVYLRTATVNKTKTIDVSLFSDTLFSCKGFNIYRSTDGITYFSVGFVPFVRHTSYYWYTDDNVNTAEQSYYYKAVIIDSCGNPRYTSNIGQTMLLKVKNNNGNVFDNVLEWNNYYNWSGGVGGYYIYRVVNDTIQTNPVNFLSGSNTNYVDNVEGIVSESGKVGYFVEAVEGFGNQYNLVSSSTSNVAFAYVEGQVYVPNAFAVKGWNKVWLPVAQFVEKTDYHVMVFDRWGTKVFDTTDEFHGWDGGNSEAGVYVYLIQYKNARGEFVELKGALNKL